MGERFEQSTAGRVVLTVLMAVLVAAVLVWNLPAGQPRQELRPKGRAEFSAAGLQDP